MTNHKIPTSTFKITVRRVVALLIIMLLAVFITPIYASPAQVSHTYTTYLTSTLYPGDMVVSKNGTFELDMQFDGNLVLYVIDRDIYGSTYYTAIWASNTDGRAVSRCVMQQDGNLVLYDYRNRPIWASNTEGYYGAYLEVQDDGNAVIYYNEGSSNFYDRYAVWATGTNARR